MPSDGRRTSRVATEIREILSTLLSEGLKDPGIGFVTVTDVILTEDLSQARVFVSVYGTPAVQAASLKGLERAAAYLRRELSQRMSLRFTPSLKFTLDESVQRGARIESLLRSLETGTIEVSKGLDAVAPVETANSVASVGEKTMGPMPPPKRADGRKGKRSPTGSKKMSRIRRR